MADAVHVRVAYAAGPRAPRMLDRASWQQAFTAYRLTLDPAYRADLANDLAACPDLRREARRLYLARMRRRYGDGAMMALVREHADATVLRALHERLDDLVRWDPAQGDLAAFVALHAEFEFNNHDRRHLRHLTGRAGTDDVCRVVPMDEMGEDGLGALDVPDDDADPAVVFERREAAAELERVVCRLAPTQAEWLRVLILHDALDPDEPCRIEAGCLRLRWRYGAQAALAAVLGVTTRTLRLRTQALEAALQRIGEEKIKKK